MRGTGRSGGCVLAAIVTVGLGRVGLVSAVQLARAGHRVVAVEREAAVRAAVEAGRPPFPEPGLAEALAAVRAAGGFVVCAEIPPLSDVDAVFVCVGTPRAPAGGLDLSDLLAVLEEIGARLRREAVRARPLCVAVRSTVLPGSCEEVLIPALAAAAGAPPGSAFELCHLPEFLRAGSALADAGDPARAVVGERAPDTSAPLCTLLATTGVVPRPVPLRLSETLKLADNAWHAAKVAFANAFGRLAAAAGVAVEDLHRLFVAETRLNLSAAYLRPGEPFGGPCLPKDIAALLDFAGGRGLDIPLLAGVAADNRAHLAWMEARVRALVPPPGPLLLFGLAFKPGTGELRESPFVELARRLLRAGYQLGVFDPDVMPEDLARCAPDLLPFRSRPEEMAQAPVLAARDDAPAGRTVLDLRRPFAVPDAPAPEPCRTSVRRGDR